MLQKSALQETEQYYVISLTKPKDIYNRIVVIDAGHGGHDPLFACP